MFQVTEAQNLIRICKEYLVGIQMELDRKGLGKTSAEDQKRSLEMAAYFTHCDLQPGHQVNVHIIFYKSDWNISFKVLIIVLRRWIDLLQYLIE